MARLSLPILEFPLAISRQDPPLREALEILRAAVGKVHPLEDVTLLSSPGGYTLTAVVGAGTSIVAGTTAIDTSDISAEEARVVVHGSAAVANATVQVYDVTNAVALCSVVMTGGAAAGIWIGAWTVFTQVGNDRQLEIRVIGNGVNTQTLNAVHLQLRSIRFTP